MPLTPRSQRLLQTLMQRGLLDQPNIRLRKMPTVPSRTQPQDYATYLLTHTSADRRTAKMFSGSLASREGAESEEQSMLGKLFDTLMTPNYAVAGAVDEMFDPDDNPLENFGEAVGNVAGNALRLAGDTFLKPATWVPGIGDDIEERLTGLEDKLAPRRTFKDVLEKRAGIDGALGAGLGLALDIGLDPTTYIGIGAGKRALQAGMKATDVLDAKAAVPESLIKRGSSFNLPKAPVAEEAVRSNVGNFPFQQLPKLPRQQVGTPLMDVAREAQEFTPRTRQLFRRQNEAGLTPQQMRVAQSQPVPNPTRDVVQKWERANKDWQRAMMRKGMVAESPAKFSTMTANNVIARLTAGDIPSTMPKVPRATGEIGTGARNVADEFIDGLMGPKRSPKGQFARREKVVEVLPAQQVNLFGKLTQVTADVDEILPALRAAEDHMITLGVQPIGPTGIRVRLSDVIAATQDNVPLKEILESFKMQNFAKMNPQVRAAIHGLAAQRSLTMGDIVANLSKYATEAQRNITDNLVGAAASKAEQDLIDTSVGHAIKMGMTNKEARSIRDLIKDVVNVDKLPTDQWINVASKQLLKAFDEGRVDGQLVKRFNEKVAESIGVTGANLQEKITGSRVLDAVMTRMATWWGKGNLQKYAHNMFVWGERNAESRAAAMRHFAKNFTKDERRAAWKVAVTGVDNADPRVTELVNFYNKYFQHVLRVPEHGLALENLSTKHLSVAERSMMLMDDVNRHLKDMGNNFQFTNKPIVRDAWGNKRNFSGSGEGWQASWSRWDPDDPVNFIYDVDLAMERATKEYAYLDDFVDKFGSLTPDAYHNFKMPLARIADFYVPEEMGRQMLRVMDGIHKGTYKPHHAFGRYYMKGLRVWKTGVTIYLPSHHVRNAIGDLHLMWWAGHNNPLAFMKAKRVMGSQRTRYREAIKSGDLDELSNLTDPQAAKWAATNGKDVIINKNGTTVNADQIYVGAHQRGLLLDANRLEDIFGESQIGIKPLGGIAHTGATQAAEYREHFIRLSHFISAIEKGLKRSKDLSKVMDEAAFEVRKWHPDGRDLTYFEQKYLRNIMPFYSWFRKSTPLLFETMLTRPAKLMAYPRAMVALQQAVGIDASMYDPFPDDQLFPDWLRESGIGPIGDATSENPFASFWGKLGRNALGITGEEQGYTMINPGNPFTDFGAQHLGYGNEDLIKGLYETITPFLKVPTDLARDDQFPGKPIYQDSGGSGVLPYLSTVLPQTAPAARVFDWGKDKDRVGVEEQNIDREAIINMLTAARLYGTGQYIKSAEFEARDRAKRANK